ncbi:glycosyltransferase family 39 protein [Oleiagrimonas sp. C23AA]|uniref:ArnT family glycosyltransferase n=1 Tax=Oleiagrimonas sp. C23AA TaxID=2719047 RepID=UPI001423685E|nr:glycosyltransferase family 39 protein [Oleiagrimonas sp. C23AA]NII09928.1 phospholipid carrier-dependent glycosyltransferase [Oleiagrimonas sp. C23AA]
MPHVHSPTPERNPEPWSRVLPWLAGALLLIPAFLMAPVPIDETRYIGVAWHMRESGQWLVPFLNGHPYPDKPPLLFWLINLFWTLTGVHAWAARALNVAVTGLGVLLLRALVSRLGGSPKVKSEAAWLWVGSLAVIAFSSTIMFDGLLTACSLGMWLGGIDLTGDRGARRRLLGIVVIALSLGLGILAKGPVALLVGGLPLALAPWWSGHARAQWLAWLGALLIALIAGAALALSWALPAAHAGGAAYENAIFLRQTVGRVADSFAHRRPIWWYLPLLPVLILPWVACMARTRTTPSLQVASDDRQRLKRFGLAAFVPAFVAFSLISGKQPHYLLPLLPALALLAGVATAEQRWRLSPARAGAVLALLGVLTAVLVYRVRLPDTTMAPALWGVASALLGVALAWRRPRPLPTAWVAVAMALALLFTRVAAVQAGGERFDITPAAQQLAYAQAHHIPVMSAGDHDGMYDFAGKLQHPVPFVQGHGALDAWMRAHPDGWVISSDRHFRYSATPLYRQPYLLGELSIWRVRDLLANGEQRHP